MKVASWHNVNEQVYLAIAGCHLVLTFLEQCLEVGSTSLTKQVLGFKLPSDAEGCVSC